MALRSTISWKYAGVRVEENNPDHLTYDITRNNVGVGNAKQVEVAGQSYFVSHGYYVPFYASQKKGEVQFQDRERIVSELKERFFRCAEPNINQMYTQSKIAWLKDKYNNTPDTRLSYDGSRTIELSDKRTIGALLVGAIINRSDRLAKAIIEKRRTGVIPDILEIEENKNVHELETELKSYLNYLMQDTHLVSCVKRNTYERQVSHQLQTPSMPLPYAHDDYDHDGVLYEMITEVAKAAYIKLDKEEIEDRHPSPMPTAQEASMLENSDKRITQGRIEKIGKAMACIDQISTTVEQMIREDPLLSQTAAGSLLRDMSNAAKALTGIKKSEVENYTEALTYYKSVQHDLDQMNDDMISKHPSTDKTLMLLQISKNLIKDMIDTRLPANEIFWIPDKQGNLPSKVRHILDTANEKWGDNRARLAQLMREIKHHMDDLVIKRIQTINPGSKVTAGTLQPPEHHAGTSAGLTM